MRFLPFLVFATLTSAGLSQTCVPPTPSAIAAYPSGTMFENIGTSDIPISSKSERAKQLVRQGFALIHCFWFPEAIRTFRDATKEDPMCATAWLGLNISLTQPWYTEEKFNSEAKFAIQKAIANVDSASDLEQDFIRAFRLRSLTDKDGDPFEQAMTTLVAKHPLADEPRLVWAGLRAQRCMSVAYMPTGDIRGDLKFVANLVEPILKRNPNCPGALHYWIHAMEPESPKRAENAADRLMKVAKGSPHMMHMPGHIYNRIGRYSDAHNAFSIAKKMDEEMAATFKIAPQDADWQYRHNVGFAISNLLELGRIDEALAMAKDDRFAKADISYRLGDFANVTNPKDAVGPMLYAYKVTLGRSELQKGNIEAAQKFLNETTDYVNKGEEVKTGGNTIYRANLTVIKEFEGLIAFAKGDQVAGKSAFEASLKAFDRIEYEEPVLLIQIPHESYGQCLIQARKYNEAITVFERGLKVRPRSGWLLYGIALAHEMAGREDQATDAYRHFLREWSKADKDRPELIHAEEYVAKRTRLLASH